VVNYMHAAHHLPHPGDDPVTDDDVLPEPPPEARRIARRRLSAVPDLSVRQCSLAAGISHTSWTELEAGRKTVAPGVNIARVGKPKTIAQMAGVLGITPDELRADGRDDAAAILDRLLQSPVFTARQRALLEKLVLLDTDDGTESN
jgi:hypothetical protein